MIKKYLSFLMLPILLISCTESTEVTDDVTLGLDEVEKELTDLIEEEDTEMYVNDWNRFKKAVADKDVKAVAAFASSDEVDSETLIMLLSVEPYSSGLAKSKFKDQTINTTEDGRSFEFYVGETGVDDEGNEVGSAVSVFFTLGKKGLELDYYLAAG